MNIKYFFLNLNLQFIILCPWDKNQYNTSAFKKSNDLKEMRSREKQTTVEAIILMIVMY